MSAEVIPFDFEEQAVRVVMRDGDPWFVAADVCRVLGIANPSDAVSRLDEDERDMVNLNTLGLTEGIRGNPNATIISEPGLYRLIGRSDKPVARQFMRWICHDVLPSIRRTGRYEHPSLPEADTAAVPELIPGGSVREAEMWLSLVREARLLSGSAAAKAMWARSPLPPLPGRAVTAGPSAEEGAACMARLLSIETCGATVRDWIARAFAAEDEAHRILTGLGLRLTDEGLFIANGLTLLAGTRWGGGAHRAALLALPDAHPSAGCLTLGGWRTRGVVVPFTSIEEARDA